MVAADLYWNGASNVSTPAAGGSGNWNAANNWRLGSDTGAQATWTSGPPDSAILAGTAGTISIDGSSVTAGSLAIQTSGYKITSTAISRSLTVSTLTLGNDVAAELNLNNAGGAWNVGGIAFGTDSTLTISGAATVDNSNRINLTTTNAVISGGAITLAGTGAGVTGFVSTATGVSLNTDITNNSSSMTMIGATLGNTLTVGGTVSGSAGVRFSAGAGGGAGTVTISAPGTYTGATQFNGATSGTIKLGVTNGISTASNVIMGYSTGNGQTLDLNGFDQTIASLASNSGGTGSITNTGSGTATSTLTINGTTSTSFGLVISDGASRKIALTKTGTSTLTLTNSSTYTGTTTVSGGTLELGTGGALASTTNVSVNTGGTLLLSGTGDQVNNAATVTLAGGTIQTNGASSINETVGALTLSSTSTIDFGTLVAGNTLSFADSSAASWVGTLNVWNWTSGTDHLFFGTSSSGLTSGQLAQINLYSDSGGTFVGNGGINGFGEISGISAVPEPSSVFVAASLLALIGWRERRWFLRCPEARKVG